MNTNSPFPLKDQKVKQILVEVANIEKQLWALIHSKGLLCSDVQELHRKVCSSYEKIILSDHEQAELQDVEYSLWKLQYKHIDEFRKRIKKSSANAVPQAVANVQKSNGNHIEGITLFLSEATEFYQNLIVKIKKCYGLPEGSSFFKRGGISTSVEPKKMQKCQFLCHRILVCLGDLARYREQFEKSGVQYHNWSVAAKHYLEATMVWPDSGNPQNQLAVLATYVGDEFLALYHCVRSLAVKEPFPDAWNNLILLFETNRSSHLISLSSEAHFDFSKPHERSSAQTKSQLSDAFSNSSMLESEHDCSLETNLWPLIIRTMSFFFIKSSSKEFPCAFASTMRELDAMMALDDTKLKATLESYHLMDSARTGPFRALQVVSIFIFIFQNLINSSEMKGSKDKNDMHRLALTQLALTAMFIFMGRFVDRCLKANPLGSCPLLPAVLVFVEWLVSMLNEAETYGADDKSTNAMSYFFGAFVDLLKRFNFRGEFSSHERTALWEDYELMGFAPVTRMHASLDFSTHWAHIDSFESGIECRAHRIINAAMAIANRSNDSRKWIIYDKLGRKFYAAGLNVIPDRKESEVESTSSDLKVKEPHHHINEDKKECEKHILGEAPSNSSVHGKSVAMDEEEVILFKPLIRYNSAPLYNSIITEDPVSPKDIEDQNVPSEECLRRATSLLIAQNQANGDPFVFHSDITNFRHNHPFKQSESLVRDTVARPYSEAPISSGPPSLNAWVLNREIFCNDGEKGKSNTSKLGLSPIEEIASASLTSLSINETEDSVISSGHESAATHYSPPPYSAPAPSAPLLPDDAAWFRGIPPSFSNSKGSGGTNKVDDLCDASQVSSYSNLTAAHRPLEYGPGIPGFMDGYVPLHGMTSSEWLRQYRENQSLDRANSYAWPYHFYAPGNPRNFPPHDASRFDLFDQWGTPPLAYNPMIYAESPPLHPGLPLVYGADEPRREKLFHGYQKPNPYGCGAVTELRNEPQPLLQYLKEKEWLLQREQALRGPTYMGN